MLVFLDFDGVLHPHPCTDADHFCWMDNLENVLFQFPNMEIVISSSWREHYSLNSLKNLFSSSIRNKISDTTPVIYDKSYSDGDREAEILLWLKQHNRPHEHWIAIDDSLNLFNLYVHHVFECDPMIGLDGPNTQNLIQFMRHHEMREQITQIAQSTMASLTL